MVKIGYRLMEMDTEGNLFPLFIDKNKPIKIGEWVKAESIPTKGFSQRPGFHVGQVCDAPWLKSYDCTDTGCYKSQRSKHWSRVWVEVSYNSNHCYDDEVEKLPKKCFVDNPPRDGYYFFKETGCNRIWVITSHIKINRILTEEERQQILKDMGYDEIKAYEKYKIAMEKRMKIAV